MSASLVGSEMCIRDRGRRSPGATRHRHSCALPSRLLEGTIDSTKTTCSCLLYTSDAADDM
eukprot:14294430-Alexandrium_andersonii.AAC.1